MAYPACIQCRRTKYPLHGGKGLCKACYDRPYRLAWYQRNRQKMMVINLSWNKAHPDQVKRSASIFRKDHSEQRAQGRMPKAYWSLRYQLLFLENRPCIQCGGYEKRQLHHIIPARFGGSYASDNLEVRCSSCHSKLHRKNKLKMIV